MASKIKNFVDDIYNAMATGESNSLLSQSPFYVYGDKSFETAEGNPPQHRWRKTGVNIIPRGAHITDDKGTNRFTLSGSAGIWQQELECTIWAADESSVIQEFALICKYINKTAAPVSNSSGIRQSSLLIDEASGQWVDTSDYVNYGEMFQFNYNMALNIDQGAGIVSTMILTASIGVSASLDGGTTYQGGPLVTTSSN